MKRQFLIDYCEFSSSVSIYSFIKVRRTILSLPARTSESVIYDKMGMRKLEKVYKYRLLMFLFKNKDLFQLHHSKQTRTRNSIAMVTAYPDWKKEHSRLLQGKYQSAILFNLLLPNIRNERSLSAFKRFVRA